MEGARQADRVSDGIDPSTAKIDPNHQAETLHSNLAQGQDPNLAPSVGQSVGSSSLRSESITPDLKSLRTPGW
jgi:hypothetical protein